MLKRVFLYGISFILLNLISCYKHEDIYYRDISLPDNGPLRTIYFFSEADTFFIKYNNNLINIDVTRSFDKKDIIGYQLLLDGSIIQESDGYPSSFYFEALNYPDGFHNLNLKIYSKTNTGSLADVYGTEAYVYEFKKVMLIGNNKELDPPVIEDFVVINGVLNVVIKPYVGYGFTSYRLTVDGFIIGDYYNKDITHIPVPKYYGGESKFDLALTAEFDTKHAIEQYSFDPKFSIEYGADSAVITWGDIPFPQVKNIDIQVKGIEEWNNYLIDPAAKQVKFPLNFEFPYHYQFFVSYEGDDYQYTRTQIDGLVKRSNAVYIKFFDDYTFRTDNIITSFLYNIYSGQRGAAKITNYKYIETNEGLFDSLSIINEKEDVFYSKGYERFYQLISGRLVELDTLTLNELSSVTIKNIIGSATLNTIYVSSNGLICFYINDSDFILYDWDNKKKLNSYNIPCTGSNYIFHNTGYKELSTSGKFAKGRFDGGSTLTTTYFDFEKLSCTNSLPSLFNFKNDTYVYLENDLAIFKSRDGTLIDEFAIDTPRGNYQYINKDLLYMVGQDQNLIIYNIDTHEKILDKQFSEKFIIYMRDHKPQIANGYFGLKDDVSVGISAYRTLFIKSVQ